MFTVKINSKIKYSNIFSLIISTIFVHEKLVPGTVNKYDKNCDDVHVKTYR
jgi:hypothetical protein